MQITLEVNRPRVLRSSHHSKNCELVACPPYMGQAPQDGGSRKALVSREVGLPSPVDES